jgi:hypothetical protein
MNTNCNPVEMFALTEETPITHHNSKLKIGILRDQTKELPPLDSHTQKRKPDKKKLRQPQQKFTKYTWRAPYTHE